VLCTEYDCDSEDEAFIVQTNNEYNSNRSNSSSSSSASKSKANAASSGSTSNSSSSSSGSKKKSAAAVATDAVLSTALGKRKARSAPTAIASDGNDDASGKQPIMTYSYHTCYHYTLSIYCKCEEHYLKAVQVFTSGRIKVVTVSYYCWRIKHACFLL
jgi:hypothetical protein